MQDTTTKPLFSAELTPNRAMTPRDQWVVVGLAGLLGAIPALICLSMGAWPVALFVAAAVLAIGVALRFSHRDGRRREQIMLWPTRLDIIEFSAKGHARHHQFNPLVVRLLIDRDFDELTTRLRLRHGDGELEIGGFLNPDDKSSFGKVFGTALKRARISPVKTGS